MDIQEAVARAILEACALKARDSEAEYYKAQIVATAAIIAFLEAAAEQGWHMRPNEATDEMIARAFAIDSKRLTYRAMLAAAPKFEWDK